MSERKLLTRRSFLKIAGLVGVGGAAAACAPPLVKAGWEFFTQTPPLPTGVPPLPSPTPGLVAIATATPPPLQPKPTEFTNVSYALIDGGITGTVPNNPTNINTLIAASELSSRPGSIVGYKIDNDYIAGLVGATRDEETKGNPHLTYSGGVYRGEGQYKNHIVEYSQGFWRAFDPKSKKEVAVMDPNSFTYALAPEAASGKPKVGFPVIDGNNILIVDKNGAEIERHALFEQSGVVAKKYGYTGLPAVVSRIGIAPDGLLRVYATEKKIDPSTKLEKTVEVPLKTLEAFNPTTGQQLAAVPELSEWISSLVTNVFDSKPVVIDSYTGRYSNATTTPDLLKKELLNYPDQYIERRVVGGQDVNALVVNGVPLAIQDSALGGWKRSLEMEKTTIDTLKPFVAAMKGAGVATSTADILRQGLQVKNITGRDKKTYPIAFAQIDPDPKKKDNPLAGDYPLFIGSEKGWKALTLKEMANINGVLVGCQGLWEGLVDGRISDSYRNGLGTNFNELVIDGELHWGGGDKAIRPSENQFVFNKANALVAFAKNNNMKVQGHHLLWGISSMIPDWLKNGGFNQEKHKVLIQEHVLKVLMQYPNFSSWSVVNEPFPYGKGVDFWYDKLGDEYIDIAFETARKANPDVLLMLNDTAKNETEGERSNFGYKTIKRLVDKGINNLGYGFQLHIDGASPPSMEKMAENMKRFTDMGVSVVITEMDVDMTNYIGSAEEKRKAQAKIYFDMVKTYLTSGGRDLSVFGVSDSVSWYEFTGKQEANATLLNDKYEPKAGYYAVLRAMFEGSYSG